MYYGARYYDPALSRFITADIIYDRGPQVLNRYSYALNNPIRYNDPSGHFINGPDDEQDPDGYGSITGSQEQFNDGTATVHDGGNGEFTQTLNEFGSGGYLTFPIDPANFKSPYPYKETSDVGLTIIHVGVSVLCEPYDWASTIYGWSQGDFSYWDLAGLLPVVSTASVKHVDNVIKHLDESDTLAHNASKFADYQEELARLEFSQQAQWKPSTHHGNELIHHAYNRHPSLATDNVGKINPASMIQDREQILSIQIVKYIILITDGILHSIKKPVNLLCSPGKVAEV